MKPSLVHGKREIFLFLLFLLLTAHAEGQPSSKLLYTDWTVQPGNVYYSGSSGERTMFQAPSGRIYNAAIGPDGALYYSDSNTPSLMRATGTHATLIYNHSTYLRDIAFDPQGRLYFSEATGAGGDGRIYRLTDGVASVFFNVSLAAVNGFWAGHFAFAPDGRLYLSTGNRSSSHLYRVDAGTPVSIYDAPAGESIAGFAFDAAGNIFYADWFHRIYRLTPSNMRTTVLDNGGRRFSDVAVVSRSVGLGPEAGRVTSVALHPTAPNKLYAGVSSGGVFRSFNGGQFWEWRGEGLTDPRVSEVLVYPPTPTTVIASTPSGVFRSTDEGASWTQVLSSPLPVPPLETPYLLSELATRQWNPVRYNQFDGSLYAAPYCAGLFRSTDGGMSWTQTYGSSGMPMPERCVTSVDVSEADGGTVFVTTPVGIRRRSGGVGGTWTNIGAEISDADPLVVRVAPSGGGARVYVLAQRLDAWPYNSNVWRRDSAGGAFARTTLTPPWLEWFTMNTMTVHPTNPDILYAGTNALYRSDDAGAHWTWVTCSSSLTCGIDYHDLTFNAAGNLLYAAHDQGIFKYDAAANTFTALDDGLTNIQLYDLDVGATGTIYVAPQDMAGFRKQGMNDWQLIDIPGDALSLLADPTNDLHIFGRSNDEYVRRSSDGGLTSATANVPGSGFWNHQLAYHPATTTLYTGTALHGVYKSTNDGISFVPANGGIESFRVRCLALAPGSDQILYTGSFSDGLYKTINGGTSWTHLASFPEPGALVIAVTPSGNRVYAGTIGGVYMSADGGNTWTPKNVGLPATKVISELVIDASCPCRLYAGLGYYQGNYLYGGGVYQSTDGGNSWTPLTTGSDAAQTITSLKIDPLDRSRLHVATYGSGARALFRDISGGCPCP